MADELKTIMAGNNCPAYENILFGCINTHDYDLEIGKIPFTTEGTS